MFEGGGREGIGRDQSGWNWVWPTRTATRHQLDDAATSQNSMHSLGTDAKKKSQNERQES